MGRGKQTDGPQTPRARRTSEICFQCRNRKVRCDGALGGCDNCRRLQFDCSLAAANATDVERRRVRRACVTCRDRKSKCSGSLPVCMRCARLNIKCQYPDQGQVRFIGPTSQRSSRMAERQSEPPSEPGTTSERAYSAKDSASPSLISQPSISRAVIKQHIDAYFDFMFPIPCHDFLHRASLLQTWSQGTLNPCLLSAICGVTMRYLPSAGNDGRSLIQEAEDQLLKRLDNPRTSDIEAWLLVTLDHILSGRFHKMLVSMSLVTRLAYILRLNFEERRLPFLLQERRRRLMWSIFATDTLYSSGRAEFTACPANTIHLQLPCKDDSFLMDVPVVTEQLTAPVTSNSSHLGLAAYCLRVLDIRDKAQRLTLAMTNRRKPLADCLDAVDGLEQQLRDIHERLPAEYQLNDKNIFLRAYTPALVTFIMLHAWWHQAHCDLYRFAIPGFREGLPNDEIARLPEEYASNCRTKCLSHALSVSGVLEMSQQPGADFVITDPSLAMCAFHSSRIISRLGQQPLGNMPKEKLVERLQACGDALEEQAKRYPRTRVLKSGIADLIRDAKSDNSIWMDEKAGGERLTMAGEVYSRYSVTEEIRKLSFEGENEARQTWKDTDRLAEIVPLASGSSISANAAAPMIPEPETECIDSDYLLSQSTVMSDFSMSMFDPRYQSGQPDMFMDSFWPIPGVSAWMAPGTE